MGAIETPFLSLHLRLNTPIAAGLRRAPRRQLERGSSPSAILLALTRFAGLEAVGAKQEDSATHDANGVPYRGQSSRVASCAPRAREPSFAHMIEG
jgi:hypothetical protein